MNELDIFVRALVSAAVNSARDNIIVSDVDYAYSVVQHEREKHAVERKETHRA
jgi:hypothetical protein